MGIIEPFFMEYMQENNVEDSAAVVRSNKRVLKYLKGISFTDEKNIDDMLTKLGYEYEKQGFVNGFRYAFEVMRQSDSGRCKA